MPERSILLSHYLRLNCKKMAKEETTPSVGAPRGEGWKLAKGDNIQITGLPFKVTNDLLKDPNVIIAIERFEKRSGRKYFGTHIVKA